MYSLLHGTQHLDALATCDAADVAAHALAVIECFNYIEAAEQVALTERVLGVLAPPDAPPDASPDASRSPVHCYLQLIHAFCCLHREQFDQALPLATAASNAFTALGDSRGAAVCMGVQATVHRSQGNLDLALKLLLLAQGPLAEAEPFAHRLMSCQNDIGGCYQELRNFDEAVVLYRAMLVVAARTDSYYWTVYALQGIGSVFLKQGDVPLARGQFSEALRVAQDQGHVKLICNSLSQLAQLHEVAGEGATAEALHREALTLRLQHRLMAGAITSYTRLSELYIRQADHAKALEALHAGLALAEPLQLHGKTARLHELLSATYEALNHLPESIRHLRIFRDVEMRVTREENSRRVRAAQEYAESEQLKVAHALIRQYSADLELAKDRADLLLMNILPDEIAEELKATGRSEARSYDAVTVLFTDFVGFTQIAAAMTATDLVAELDTCFRAFDGIITQHDIEKIKTIGDAYMCVGGLPAVTTTHATDVVRAALEIRDFMQAYHERRVAEGKPAFAIRIGVHTGPVVAGVVGARKFAFDVWGDTVNTASRMESSGEAGRVNISAATYALVKDRAVCVPRGKVYAKNKGEIEMYFVERLG